jgi:hypothetical protein
MHNPTLLHHAINAIKTVSQDLDSLDSYLDRVFNTVKSENIRKPITTPKHSRVRAVQRQLRPRNVQARSISVQKPVAAKRQPRDSRAVKAIAVNVRSEASVRKIGIKALQSKRSSSVLNDDKRRLGTVKAKLPRVKLLHRVKDKFHRKSIEALRRPEESFDASLRHSSSFYYAALY